jgi:hypothetical protein
MTEEQWESADTARVLSEVHVDDHASKAFIIRQPITLPGPRTPGDRAPINYDLDRLKQKKWE